MNITELFKKLDIDCIVSVSQRHHWADADPDGRYGGINVDLMLDWKCLGINTNNQTIKEISFSPQEKEMIEKEWFAITGHPDNSEWVADGWYDYSWEFLFIENDQLKVISGELVWDNGTKWEKEDIPFLPNQDMNFSQSKRCEENFTKFWEVIVDCSFRGEVLFGKSH